MDWLRLLQEEPRHAQYLPLFPVDSLALGSGIGGAVIVDGKLVHGGSGWAGEPGHQVPFPSPRCHSLDLPA